MRRISACLSLHSVLDDADDGVDDTRLVVSDPRGDDWQVLLAVPSFLEQ